MKTRIYDNIHLTNFPLYPSTSSTNKYQQKVIRPDGYEMHQIFLVSGGCGILNIKGCTYNISKNDFFYIAANTPHEYYGIDSTFKTTYLSFFGEGFAGIKTYYNLGTYGVYKNKNKGYFESYVKNLYEVFDVSQEIASLCAMTFSTVISFFDEACKKKPAPIEAVYEYLEENYSKPLTLNDILSIYSYSKAKLCRDFKDRYNYTIFQTITDIRLRHAHRLIKNFPHLCLTDIAASCGFSDASYFCKMYKRRYGHSPKGK